MDTTTIRSYEPAARSRTLMRVGNLVMRPLLRSRLGARIPDLALLTFRGRRTGRRYEVPVAVYPIDGADVVLTASRWRANLRGGAEVELRHRGVDREMHAELIDDPDEVATIYSAMLDRVGLDHAKRVGLVIDGGTRLPTHDDLVRAIGGRRSAIRLVPR
jgi:hypothetical protein